MRAFLSRGPANTQGDLLGAHPGLKEVGLRRGQR